MILELAKLAGDSQLTLNVGYSNNIYSIGVLDYNNISWYSYSSPDIFEVFGNVFNYIAHKDDCGFLEELKETIETCEL